jgi:hypothetical protein
MREVEEGERDAVPHLRVEEEDVHETDDGRVWQDGEEKGRKPDGDVVASGNAELVLRVERSAQSRRPV